jgi:hypothetical protein
LLLLVPKRFIVVGHVGFHLSITFLFAFVPPLLLHCHSYCPGLDYNFYLPNVFLTNAIACLKPELKTRMAMPSKDKYRTSKKRREGFMDSMSVPSPRVSSTPPSDLARTCQPSPFALAVVSRRARHLFQLISPCPGQHRRRQHCSSHHQRSWSCHRARLVIRRARRCCTCFFCTGYTYAKKYYNIYKFTVDGLCLLLSMGKVCAAQPELDIHPLRCPVFSRFSALWRSTRHARNDRRLRSCWCWGHRPLSWDSVAAVA